MKKLLYTLLFVGIFFGCSKKETATVTPKPTADFSWTESTGGVIQFTNNSKNADSYQWDFGDNMGKSTSQNPKYTFEYKGDYQVKLTAKGAGGEADAINTVKITTGKEPKPIVNFDIKDLGKGNFQFTNTSQYADTYSWDFGDGSASAKDKEVSHQYFSNAKFKVTLTASGKGGTGSKLVELEAKNVPDPRDGFVGEWIRTYRLEGVSKEYTNTVSISKSNLNAQEVLLKVKGDGYAGYPNNSDWVAVIKAGSIEITNQKTGYETISGTFSLTSLKGTLDPDGKSVMLEGTFKNERCCDYKTFKSTELWTKQ